MKNTGSIPDELTVATSVVSSPFSIIGAPFAPQHLNGGASFTYNTGVQWGELTTPTSARVAPSPGTWIAARTRPQVIFDNTPAIVPSNLPSYGPEAYSFNEWGGGVAFAGSARKLATATVTMSSWACQSGSWKCPGHGCACVTTPGATFNAPVTFNVYSDRRGRWLADRNPDADLRDAVPPVC